MPGVNGLDLSCNFRVYGFIWIIAFSPEMLHKLGIYRSLFFANGWNTGSLY